MNRKHSSKQSRGFGSRRNNSSNRLSRHASFEPLETRNLLAVTIAPIVDQTLLAGAPLNIALNGTNTANNPITYTTEVQGAVGSPQVTATVPTGNTFLKLHITDTGNGIVGDMVFELFKDLAPNTVSRITTLVDNDFYDGLIFHRIIEDFMIQGGDPDGTGMGGSGITFDDEYNVNSQYTSTGLLAMAKSLDDTNDSQFFITNSTPRTLDFNHTIFGKLVQGSSVLAQLNNVPTDSNDRPISTVTITSASIITDNTDGVLRLSAAIGQSGTTQVKVTATDSVTGDTTSQMVTVTVAADTNNAPPFMGTITPIQTSVNTPVTINIPATDAESDAIYYSYDPDPANTSSGLTVAINNSTGSVTITPSSSLAPGVYKVKLLVARNASYVLTDGYSYDSQVVPVYVNPAAPTAITLKAVSDTGNDSDQITSLNNSTGKTLQFQVDGVVSGRTVQLYSDGTLIGEANATGTSVVITTNGTVSLTDGSHAITAKQILKNQAVNVGNLSTTTDLTSAASTPLAITVDTIAPQFNFTAITTAVPDQVYNCKVTVAAPSTGVTFQLISPPTGMTINASTGLISWTPTAAQLTTSQTVTVKATDLAGNTKDTTYNIALNTAPVLTSVNVAPAIGPTMGHTSKDTVFNTDFSTFINHGTGTTIITDQDTGAVVGGIAITFASGKGKWEYSLDGTTFVQFSPINSAATSLLLPKDAKLRYTPDGKNSESAIITYRAWDMSTGTSGGIVDLSAPTSHGTTTAFSDGYDSAQILVNDAPVLTPANPSMGITNNATPITIPLINSFINHGTGTTIITDPNDNDTGGGIVLTGFTGNGLWEYKPIASSGYLPLPSDLSLSSALILSKNTASLRYTPDPTKGNETATITYYAWDNTFSSNNKRVDISQASSRGGTTAFSTVSDTASITVAVAPILTPAHPVMGSATSNAPLTVSLTGSFINNGTWNGKPTTTITAWNVNGVAGGIAITGVTGYGVWEYSTDGTTFQPLPSVSDSSALLLAKDAKLRYTPSNGDNSVPATITYHAWDKTSGSNGGTADLSQPSSMGGTTAFSVATDTASVTVIGAPILTPAHPVMGSATSDAPLTVSLTGSFINNGAGTTTIIASNTNAVAGGIAITGVTGNGTWTYSTDGITFQTLPSVSDSAALLLDKNAKLRYTPSGTDNSVPATITYHAWDTTTGTNGMPYDISQAGSVGGATAFSFTSDTASVTVTGAPILTAANPVIGNANSNTPLTVSLTGTFINNGTWNGKPTTTITASNANAVVGGIAITGITGNGVWAYSIDNGVNFTPITTASESAALPLPKDALLRYTPSSTNNSVPATITYRAWDKTSGVAGTPVDLTQPNSVGGTSAYSFAEDTATVNVNDAPVLTQATPSMGSTDEKTTIDISLTTFITSDNTVSGKTIITDINTANELGGIALTGITGNGTWKYKLNIPGATFQSIGAVSLTSALLLPKDAILEYVPDNKNGETATITYLAWDKTTGNAGDHVNLSTAGATGGASAFSTASDTAKLTVTDINDAPVITSVKPEMGKTPNGTAFTISLTSFITNDSTVSGKTLITDVDNGAIIGGIAVVGITGSGVWAYSLDDGATYHDITSASESSALLLPKTAMLRYTPGSSLANETATIIYHAWDTTSGNTGDQVDLTVANATGDATAFSIATDMASVVVNDAPVLTVAHPSLGKVTNAAPSIINLDGTFINHGTGTTSITDLNLNAVIGGIALVGVTGNGTWAYSLDNGTTFTAVGTVSGTSALLLPKTAQLRYTPNGSTGETATITYRAWDTTTGNAGAKVDASSTGGATAFSADSDTASLTVRSTPTDISLSPSNVPDNSAIGTTVGSFTTASPDSATDTFTYTLVSGTGSTDNAAFTISGNTLKTAVTFNAIVKSSYSIRVRTTDDVGLFFEKVITITITDVTPPSVTINQQTGQLDPTHNAFVTFVVVFSEPVTDFTANDVTLSGTAPGASVTKVLGSGTTYEVQVGGMTASGTVVATIAAGKVHDASGNLNLASTSTDNSVQYTKEWAIYAGTAKNDTFVVLPGTAPGTWQVKVNSTIWAVPAGLAGITLDGLGGNDTVKIIGNDSNETFELWQDHAAFVSGNFRVETTNMEYTACDGAGGGNTAIIHDGATSNSYSLQNVSSMQPVLPRADFNGDGTADVLWFNQSTGQVGTWIIRNGAYSSWSPIANADFSTWNPVGTGDFNGDGTADILWQNKTTGQVVTWIVRNGAYSSWAPIAKADLAWKPIGTGDFNGDGTADILWQNQSTGKVGAWIIRNGAYNSWAPITDADLSTAKAVGTGDFNGDGTTDILWQNQSTGQIGAWIIRNGAYSSSTSIAKADLTTWKLIGTGDFNGDGTADILWQNQSTGQVGAWIIRNGNYNSWAPIASADPSVWKISNIGDFNGDGTADVLWQNQSTGQVGAWIVKNGAYNSWAPIASANPTDWKPAGQYSTVSFMKADSELAAPAAGTPSLTQGDLKPIVQEALTRWKNARLDAATLDRLSQVQFVISNLPGSDLGEADGNHIYLDLNAAGHGWFVDSTPTLDEEFASSQTSQSKAIDARALDRIDLLTVVEHELGHIAGFDDLDALAENVMNGVLGAGIRRNPK